MKAKGKFVSAILVIDTFFISFALAFNARPVLVVDPSLPPVAKPKPAVKAETVEKTKTSSADKKPVHADQSNQSQSHLTQSHSDKKVHAHKKAKHVTKLE